MASFCSDRGFTKLAIFRPVILLAHTSFKRVHHEFTKKNKSFKKITQVKNDDNFLPVIIYAGQDKEEAGSGCAALFEAPQPEYDGPFVLLHHFDAVAQGKREGDQDQNARDDRQEQGAEPGDVLGPAVGYRQPGVVVVLLAVLPLHVVWLLLELLLLLVKLVRLLAASAAAQQGC